MGSEQRVRNGLSGTADGGKGLPEQFVVVDLDISASDLKARYAGTKRHAYICEIVDGAVQRQRTKHPPSAAFARGLRRAKQIPALSVCDLGRDGTKDGKDENGKKAGRNHVIIIDGRQRNMATRENNRLNAEENGAPPRQLECSYVTFPAEGTRQAVVLFKVGSNVREARSFSSRAEDAADMGRSGYADEDIAPYVEMTTAADVELLRLLDGCCEEVKASVDAGLTGLVAVRALSRLSHGEQARRVARKVAGPSKAARDTAAPARSKSRPARVLESVEAEVLATIEDASALVDEGGYSDLCERRGFAKALAWARGGEAPTWAKAMIESAEATRKASS